MLQEIPSYKSRHTKAVHHNIQTNLHIAVSLVHNMTN